MALILAAPLAKGLLATAIRTAGSKAVQPYVTALVREGAGRKAATQIAKEYVKTVGKANKTGAFPLIDKAATKNITKVLSNTQRSELQRKGLLASDAPAATISRQRMIGGGESRRLLQEQTARQTGPTFNFPPTSPVSTPTFTAPIPTAAQRAVRARQIQAERNAAQAALNRGRGMNVPSVPRGTTMPGSQSIQSPLRAIATTGGLVGTAAALPMIFGGGEVAPQTVSVPTQAPADTTIRDINQVISPTESATSKQILNAALLRAGLSIMQGGSPREALTAAGTVADSRNKFRTGAEALAAGQRNLGKTATIYVSQNKDGTYKYSGQSDSAAEVLAGLFGNEQVQAIPKGKITKEQRDALAVIIKQQQPNATEQDITDTLADRGYIYPYENKWQYQMLNYQAK